MTLTTKTYDKLKFIAQILLPALGTLYFALAAIWGLPSPEKVIGSITSVDAFLGVVLGISTSSFNKQVGTGNMNVTETAEGKTFSLELDHDPEVLDQKKQIRLHVVPHVTVHNGH